MFQARMLRFLRSLSRTKHLELDEVDSNYRRSLSILDLLALGVGSTLGAGVYVISGEVSRTLAGPSIAISFLIAAVASIFAGLCYAEFGSRVPKTGSTYLYCYVTVGEIWAFLTGWNLLLSYVIGTSSVATAWSGTFDNLIGNVIAQYLEKNVPMNIPGLAPYPNFFSAGLILLLTGLLAVGVKESVLINRFFAAINIILLLFVIIAGFMKGDFNNWFINEDSFINQNNTPPNGTSEYGKGGFFPFGFSGTLAGAAICFYAFTGFDYIATSGEEVMKPQTSIPIGIVLSLFICFTMYSGVSAALTLMMPYHMLSIESPLPVAFTYIGWDLAKYTVTVGSLCALSTSLFGSIFPMPQVLCAMANDGLLFSFLSKVSARRSPAFATLVSGFMAAVMALLFDLRTLVEMMSIGTLSAYSTVAIYTVILRYQADADVDSIINEEDYFTMNGFFCPPRLSTKKTSTLVSMLAISMFFLASAISLAITKSTDALLALNVWSFFRIFVLVTISVILMLIIRRQPQCTSEAAFKVPFMPFLPFFSTFINNYLMIQLGADTWICYGVWMFAGLVVYFGYGMNHSNEKQRVEETQDHIGFRGDPPFRARHVEPLENYYFVSGE